MFLFTDFVPEPETRYHAAYIAIGFISIILTVNMGIVIWIGGRRFYLYYLRLRNRCRG